MKNLLDWGITFGGDVAAAIIGSKIAHDGKDGKDDGKHKTTTGEMAGIIIRERIEKMKFDRGEFLHELNVINSKTNGGIKAIFNLFNEFERGRGILTTVDGRIYRENWVGKMMMEIDPQHRTTEYQRLNDLLLKSRNGREEFFARLEILNDDKIQQLARQSIASIKKFASDHGVTAARLNEIDQSAAGFLNSLLQD